MKDMINNLGERMVTLMRVVNIYGMSGNKLAYELHGMTMALQAMDIEFEFDFTENVDQYKSITIMGIKFDC